jgi:bifunctional DNase/RNase
MYNYFRSRRKRRLAYLLTFIAIVIIGFLLYSIYVLTRFETVLTTEGYIPMKVDKIVSTLDHNIVILKGECTELNFFISLQQALAINEGFSEATKFRPMTHDILVDILNGFELKPVMVKITKISENTYFAELTLQEWNRILIVDIRPSDAIAIAVRTNTPIYVNEDLVMKTC